MTNGMPETGFWKILLPALTAALVTFIVAAVTIPTDLVVGRLKFAMNRADLREDKYNEISRQISRYVFEAQVFQEFFELNVTNRSTVEKQAESYNGAITDLRASEYAHRAVIRKYWSDSTAQRFDELIKILKAVDAAAHEMNGPLNDYLNDTRQPPMLDSARTIAAAKKMRPLLDSLCHSADEFLLSLSGDNHVSARRACN